MSHLICYVRWVIYIWLVSVGKYFKKYSFLPSGQWNSIIYTNRSVACLVMHILHIAKLGKVSKSLVWCWTCICFSSCSHWSIEWETWNTLCTSATSCILEGNWGPLKWRLACCRYVSKGDTWEEFSELLAFKLGEWNVENENQLLSDGKGGRRRANSAKHKIAKRRPRGWLSRKEEKQ